MTQPRPRLVVLLTVLVVTGLAGGATAVSSDSGGYESGSDEERNPWCMDESSAIAIDPSGEDPIAKVPLDITFGPHTVVRFCSGEHWDGQDPNTKDSDADTDADESEGAVYVNPLGDCSGWDSDNENNADGCSGGTDRPQGPEDGDVIDLRVTGGADAEPAGDDRTQATAYLNGETWGLGRMAVAAHHGQDERAGYAAIFLEDHSDQIFADILGDPLDTGDGNYLAWLVDPLQAGGVAEGDCTQFDYVHTQEDGHTEDRDGHDHPERSCPRDNGAFTLEYGFKWAPGQDLLP